MITITSDIPAINTELLDDELRLVLASKLIGVSTNPREVLVHLEDRAEQSDFDLVSGVLNNHDATAMSQREQNEVNHRLAQKGPLDPVDYELESPAVFALAEKVAWLEVLLEQSGLLE